MIFYESLSEIEDSEFSQHTKFVLKIKNLTICRFGRNHKLLSYPVSVKMMIHKTEYKLFNC